MDDNIAISVKDVSKNFRLPHNRVNSVKGLFAGLLKNIGTQKTVEVQHALKGVSFDIKEGEFFGIVGRNGSGKSTLLKMLAGIYQPTKGTIGVRGRLVPFIELGVGFNPELTGRENVYLNGALLGFSPKEIDQMYNDIVEFAELEKFMDQKLKNYSSGMQVRLAFSMAIRADADILLIDEVLAVGDADFQRKCYEYFNHLKKSKMTVVFVSHDMDAVRQFCDRTILVDNSKVVAFGPPHVIASKYSKIMFQGSLKSKKTSTAKHGSSGEERWGDGRAKILSVTPDSKEYEKGDTIRISIVVRAERALDDPIIGFSIKNDRFEQLLGANTLRLERKLSPLKPEEEIETEWYVPNILNGGTYHIDATVAHEDVNLVADRWPEAASFLVFDDQSTPYRVNPVIKVNIGRGDK